MIGRRDAERLGSWFLVILFFALAGLAGGGGDRPIIKPAPEHRKHVRHDKRPAGHHSPLARGTH